jgi:hypothetical protein
VTPLQLVAAARRLLVLQQDASGAATRRAAAFLGRQAIEEALAQFWQARAPGLEQLNFRTQWTCLNDYLSDRDLTASASFAWASLSRACHFHYYELAPAIDEVSHWLDLAEAWCTKVEALAQPARDAQSPPTRQQMSR